MSHHAKTLEIGGWTLLIAAIGLLVYFLFHPKGREVVTSRIAPTKYPVITPAMADAIGSGRMAASVWQPGVGCDGNIFDNGSGQLWCVDAGAPN